MPHITIDATANAGVTLNMLRSISSPCGLFLLFGSVSVNTTINKIMMMKTHDMRFRKGMASIQPLVKIGRNLKSIDSGMVTSAAASAALDVVFFQKKPNRNMANTPGDMKPTYS